MANFLDDTRVEGIDGESERWRAVLSPSWAVWGPNGGYVAAIALRAAMARSRLPRPASFHCDFLAVGEVKNFEVLRLEGGGDTTTLVQGRAVLVDRDGRPARVLLHLAFQPEGGRWVLREVKETSE